MSKLESVGQEVRQNLIDSHWVAEDLHILTAFFCLEIEMEFLNVTNLVMREKKKTRRKQESGDGKLYLSLHLGFENCYCSHRSVKRAIEGVRNCELVGA